VLRFTLQKKNKFELIIEFIPPGNVLLTMDDVIIRAFKEKKWQDRIVKPDFPYKLPPTRLNLPELKKTEFMRALKKAEKDLVRGLAINLNLGGLYAEELCIRAGVDKKKNVKNLLKEEVENVYTSFKELVKEIKVKRKPTVVFRNEEIFDITPIELEVHSGHKSKEFETLNQALSFYLDQMEEEETAKDVEVERIKRIIKSQNDAVVKWEYEIGRAHRVADQIYEHYVEIEEILKQLKTDKTFTSPVLKSYSPKTRTGVLDFKGEEIRIKTDKTIHQNAQVYYDKVKRARNKLEAVVVSIEKSTKDLIQATKRVKREQIEKARPAPRKKKLWFERYKWFISSEGFLVISGRDAKSNENIFRKHLKAGDRYVHADIPGAPSVVVKDGARASGTTLKEACQFSLAHSKAWSSGLASGTAYWVKPEQVSKTPESGEYLPKGAFVIRGKRNYLRRLEMELAVGEMEYENENVIMCSPPSVLEKISHKYIIFRPGEKKKNQFAKELGKKFKVSVDDILPILPPGDVAVVEKKGF